MLENVIKKLFPIRDEKGRPCTFPTFGSQVFSDGDGRALYQADKGIYADHAKNAETLDGKDSVYFHKKFSHPRNLLDNSDFRNPVNQRGQTTYSLGSERYTLDRWFALGNTNVYILDDRIEVSPAASSARGFRQFINKPEKYAGKRLTFAVSIKNVVGEGAITINDISESRVNFTTPGVYVTSVTIANDVSSLFVQVGLSGTTDAERIGIEWAALYEGEYTADNLPPYVPKGYATELAECMRYFQSSAGKQIFLTTLSDNAGFYDAIYPLAIPMVSKPTVTAWDDAGNKGKMNIFVLGAGGWTNTNYNQRLTSEKTISARGSGVATNTPLSLAFIFEASADL